jgi:hypothetical protein
MSAGNSDKHLAKGTNSAPRTADGAEIAGEVIERRRRHEAFEAAARFAMPIQMRLDQLVDDLSNSAPIIRLRGDRRSGTNKLKGFNRDAARAVRSVCFRIAINIVVER